MEGRDGGVWGVCMRSDIRRVKTSVGVPFPRGDDGFGGVGRRRDDDDATRARFDRARDAVFLLIWHRRARRRRAGGRAARPRVTTGGCFLGVATRRRGTLRRTGDGRDERDRDRTRARHSHR